MKLISMPAVALAALLSLAGSVAAAPLPNPPPPGGMTAGAIIDAMLAISRAQAADPAAAQAATFSYYAALQQYNIHDYSRARQSAVAAIAQAGAPPAALAAPPIVASAAVPLPTYYPTAPAAGADDLDAQSYVGLAQRALARCGAPGSPPAVVQQQLKSASDALAAKHFDQAKAAATYVINQCAAAAQNYMASVAAIPLPSTTPPLNYSPLPVATLIPDPALQQTPKPLPTPTPAPVHRR